MKYIVNAVIVVDASNERATRNYIDLILRIKPNVREYKITHVELKDGKP